MVSSSNPEIAEAIRQVKDALARIDEPVVRALAAVHELERELSETITRRDQLMAKAAQAEVALNRPELATTLREEASRLAVTIEALTKQAQLARSGAEATREQAPERRQRLQQQLTELMQKSVEYNAQAAGADSSWDRVRRSEASTNLADIQLSGALADDRADKMLLELEQRLGTTTPSTREAPVQSTVAQVSTAVPTLPDVGAAPNAVRVTGRTDTVERENRPKGLTVNMTSDQTRLRVAAIGTGGIFRGAHLPCYLDIPGAQLAALCDPDPDALKQAVRRLRSLTDDRVAKLREQHDDETADRLLQDLNDLKLYSDLDEVIAAGNTDLVDICTQPFLHAPLSIKALNAGLHVMCEKPISRSWLETEPLINSWKSSGKFYQHNENWLFEPEYYTVRKLVQSGAIGELITMFLTQAHGGPEGRGAFWNPAMGGGGSLLDNGIHAIGAAWFVAGLDWQPAAVRAVAPFGMATRMSQRILDGRYQTVQVDDDAHILIRFENTTTGAWCTAHIEGSWSFQDSPPTQYIGSTGRIEMAQQDGRQVARVFDAHGNHYDVPVSGPTWVHWPSSFYGEILNMVQCIVAGEQSIMTPQFGADCSSIVGAAYLSEKQGRKAVTLQEFQQFARSIAAKHADDKAAANDALVNELLSAVRR